MRSHNHQSYYGIHHGMDLRDAIDACHRLGGAVLHRRRAGEVVFAHPLLRERVVVNHRRKDTSRTLTGWLMKVERAITVARRKQA